MFGYLSDDVNCIRSIARKEDLENLPHTSLIILNMLLAALVVNC